MDEKLRKHIEKIIPLTDEDFAFIAPHFIEKKLRKHQFLIQAGEPVRYVCFVVSGLLKLAYTDDSGRQHIVSFAMEDWWESDFLAYHTQSAATLSLDCLKDTEVLCLLLDDYHKLRHGFPMIERFLLQKSISGSIALQQGVLSLLTTNARERYEQLLNQQPSLIQRVPKILLASYLGVSRETLSQLSSSYDIRHSKPVRCVTVSTPASLELCPVNFSEPSKWKNESSIPGSGRMSAITFKPSR